MACQDVIERLTDLAILLGRAWCAGDRLLRGEPSAVKQRQAIAARPTRSTRMIEKTGRVLWYP